MRHTGKATDTSTLESLLQAERCAVDTYRQVIAKFSQEPEIDQIYAVQRDHRVAVSRLTRHIEEHGGKPTEESHPWDAFVKVVNRSGKLFHDPAALKALRDGEEKSLRDYKEAMEGGKLADDCIELIRPFLVQDRQHIALIGRLMERI